MASLNEVLLLILEIQIFTVSGALAPGPLSMATFGAGLKEGWKAGIFSATGHLIAELPIFYLIALGLLTVESVLEVRWLLLIVGGLFLIYLAIQHIRIDVEWFEARGDSRHPLLIGFIFSLFNPYFILWWVMIGSIFIYDTLKLLGFGFLPLIYLTHVWMDYFWLTFLSILAGYGVKRFGGRIVRIVNIVLGFILLFFAGMFLYDAISTFIIS